MRRNPAICLCCMARCQDVETARHMDHAAGRARREPSQRSLMLVSHRLRIVFVHIPKNGGHSIRAAIRSFDPGSREVGQWHWGATACKLFAPHDYEWFASVRNPWDRMVSAWAFTTGRRVGFDEFMDSHLRPPYRNPQTDWLRDTEGKRLVYTVCRYETLAKDFAHVCPRAHPLTRLNQSEHEPYQHYYTSKTRETVAALFAADIAEFGYRF